MPRTKKQELIFSLLMVFFMVYAMICYNIALNMGGMNYAVFGAAFHELIIMYPIVFLLDFFFVGNVVKKTAFKIVDPEKENPFHLVLAISAITVMWMCPLMSLAATLLFKDAGINVIPVWIQTIAVNFPMAFFWQMCYAGPLVRFLFRKIMRQS